MQDKLQDVKGRRGIKNFHNTEHKSVTNFNLFSLILITLYSRDSYTGIVDIFL